MSVSATSRDGFRVTASAAVVPVLTMRGSQRRRGLQAYVYLTADPHTPHSCGHAHAKYRTALACGVRLGRLLLQEVQS